MRNLSKEELKYIEPHKSNFFWYEDLLATSMEILFKITDAKKLQLEAEELLKERERMEQNMKNRG